jgi:hypothetical protein
MKRSFALILVCVLLCQCTIFKKEIKKPVVVKIVAPEMFASVSANVNYVKYVTESPAAYQSKFMDNFMSEGKGTNNVTIDNESQNPDYILQIKNLSVTEGEFTQTVSDASSPANGQNYFLNKVGVSCEVLCIDGKTNKQIGFSCNNMKGRQEKVKNNRTLDQMVTGSNKDHKSYHEKAMRSSIAMDLAGDVGRRVWVPITKRIRKSLK